MGIHIRTKIVAQVIFSASKFFHNFAKLQFHISQNLHIFIPIHLGHLPLILLLSQRHKQFKNVVGPTTNALVQQHCFFLMRWAPIVLKSPKRVIQTTLCASRSILAFASHSWGDVHCFCSKLALPPMHSLPIGWKSGQILTWQWWWSWWWKWDIGEVMLELLLSELVKL